MQRLSVIIFINFLIDVLNIVQKQLHIYDGKIKEAQSAFVKAIESLKDSERIAVIYTHYLITKTQLNLELVIIQRTKGENYNHKIKELLKDSKKLISKSQKLIAKPNRSLIV